MRNAILIHGMPSQEEYFDPASPSPSCNHWFSWLQRQLILNRILTQTPEMPTPYSPRYADWDAVFRQFQLSQDTLLVGHSLGAGFLLRWLSENSVEVGRVALVAPWLDPNNRLSSGFLDFAIDPELASQTKRTVVFISDDDDQEELVSVDTLKSKVQHISVKEFQGKGHFILEHMGTEEFPELLDYLLE